MGKNGPDMLPLVIIILIVAAVTGVLWDVLQIAAGVALGIFFAGVLLAGAAYFALRHWMRRAFGPPRSRRP